MSHFFSDKPVGGWHRHDCGCVVCQNTRASLDTRASLAGEAKKLADAVAPGAVPAAEYELLRDGASFVARLAVELLNRCEEKNCTHRECLVFDAAAVLNRQLFGAT